MSGKTLRAVLGGVVVAVCSIHAASVDPAMGEPVVELPGDPELARLVQQLDSQSFREREHAQQVLVQLPGLFAAKLEQLQKTAESPETRGRLEQIIRQRRRGAWKSDMAQALSAARGEDKLVMVFSTRGPVDGYSCMGANLMRRTTFADEKLVQDLRKQVVSVWHDQNSFLNGKGQALNCALQPGQAAPTEAMIKSYPVGGGGGNLRTYFCAPSGKIVHYIEGYWPAKQFAAEVRYAQAQYRAMKATPAAAMPQTLAAKLTQEIVAIEAERKLLIERHPAEFKKPFPQSEIRRRHASLGLKVKAYRDAMKLAGKDVSPVLAQLMILQIGRGAII
jgi:hypothetical protein